MLPSVFELPKRQVTSLTWNLGNPSTCTDASIYKDAFASYNPCCYYIAADPSLTCTLMCLIFCYRMKEITLWATDKTPLELRWHLEDRLLLLLVQQQRAHTELSCNDRSGYTTGMYPERSKSLQLSSKQQGDAPSQLRSNEEFTWNIYYT